MNCRQARIQLAAYRELKNMQMDTTELDVHLEHCAECRSVLAQANFISERLKVLPTIEPTSASRTKMMHALAAEHTRFLQNSPATAPLTPDFLKPYMQQQAQGSPRQEALTAFTTAETGPLPVIRTRPRYRRTLQLNQFAVIGLAAAFLLVIMTGGLAGLLVFATHGVQNIPPASINQPSQIAMARYSTITSYPHVVSAVADHEHIYYTAYGDGNNGWMLEQVNSTNQTENNISMPLLENGSSSSLIVLDGSENWVVWLQFDQARAVPAGHSSHSEQYLERTWALRALPIGTNRPIAKDSFATPITLLTGTFDESGAPGWTHTPIQGLWMAQDTLMVAMIDSKGTSHLLRGQLDTVHGFTSTELATARDGHVLSSPTSNSDGSLLYWSEEWMDSNRAMHSNIWTQETLEATPIRERWHPDAVIKTYLFRTDEQSFHPQMVNDTLFFLSMAPSSIQAAQGESKPAAATPTAATSVNNTQIPIVNRIDATTYPAQTDAAIRGTLLAVPETNSVSTPLIFSDDSASGLQSGESFILWQSDKGYEMYDAIAKSTVNVSQVPAGANFLAVNADTAIWMVSNDNVTSPAVTFREFQWPNK